MRTYVGIGLLAFASVAAAQHGGHGGGKELLFLARASGDQVVPKQQTSATATAAIIFSRAERNFRYDLTYSDLERGPPSQILLRNFGEGGNGKDVAVICGAGSSPCPDARAARLSGRLAGPQVAPSLLSEFASGRVYLEIVGSDGRGEIRGQLDANGAMVPSRTFVARLAPAASPGAAGEGTAVLSETYLPDDRVAVDYSVTVAGTNGVPQDVSLVGVSTSTGAPARFNATNKLLGRAAPRLRQRNSFNGSYIARRTDTKSVFATKMLADGTQSPALSVRTSRFPNGELYGVFVPVD